MAKVQLEIDLESHSSMCVLRNMADPTRPIHLFQGETYTVTEKGKFAVIRTPFAVDFNTYKLDAIQTLAMAEAARKLLITAGMTAGIQSLQTWIDLKLREPAAELQAKRDAENTCPECGRDYDYYCD